MLLSDIIGIMGGLMLLSAFFALQNGRLSEKKPSYHVINTVGAIMILISLVYSFNLPSFVLEIIWLLVALYGVWKTKYA